MNLDYELLKFNHKQVLHSNHYFFRVLIDSLVRFCCAFTQIMKDQSTKELTLISRHESWPMMGQLYFNFSTHKVNSKFSFPLTPGMHLSITKNTFFIHDRLKPVGIRFHHKPNYSSKMRSRPARMVNNGPKSLESNNHYQPSMKNKLIRVKHYINFQFLE